MKKSFLLSSLLLPLALASSSHADVAYGFVDVADFKPTTGDVAFGYPTSNGNDGNYGTFNHADNINPPPNNPFWEVDLQGSFNLTNFVVTDRADCCDPNRLNGSTITLLDAGGGTIATETINGIPDGTFGTVFDFDNGGAGYLGVSKVRIDGSTQYFQFGEFDAFDGTVSPTPFNWALGAAAGFYDSAGAPVAAYAGSAGLFVDGSNNTYAHPVLLGSPLNSFAEIDLGQEVNIDNITITGRVVDGCCPERLTDYQVQFLDASGTLVHSIDHPLATTTTETIDVITGFGGLGPQARFLRVVNTSGTDYAPQIGEIQVFGVTSPPPPPAVFQITDVTTDTVNGNATVVFNSVAGRSYLIYGSSNLVDWAEVKDNITAASTSTESDFSDPDLIGALERYYRVQDVTP